MILVREAHEILTGEAQEKKTKTPFFPHEHR